MHATLCAHLIIEVAESSLATDRGLKQRLYAACKVPEYWIVNLIEGHIEVYSDPAEGAYATTRRYDRTESTHPMYFPDLEVRVADILK